MTAPALQNLEHVRGDSFTRIVTLSEPLIAFTEVCFTLREVWASAEENDSEAELSLKLSNGGLEAGDEDDQVVIEIDAEDTRDWTLDDYVYDVQVTTTGGKVYTVLRGFLRVTPDVTRSS